LIPGAPWRIPVGSSRGPGNSDCFDRAFAFTKARSSDGVGQGAQRWIIR